MARTTYRSKVAITNANRKRMAYSALVDIIEHVHAWGLNLLRVEVMPDSFVEVDTSDPIPVQHVDHLNLTGPV